MIDFLEKFFQAMRPAFSRKAAFVWFVVAFAGFVMHNDLFGVTSIVRTLLLAPASYPCLLNFFHSGAWSVQSLRLCWWQWLVTLKTGHTVNGRIVILGDHTKTPKDGRKIPAIETLHQESETASKPSFFRGHHWGCLGLLCVLKNRASAIPLWMEIHRAEFEQSRATRMIVAAGDVAQAMGQESAYLVLDAFFAVGPAFLATANLEAKIDVLTRAKKNVVAYRPAPEPSEPRRGRKRKYGQKVKLKELFEKPPKLFDVMETAVYGKKESVRCLTLDLLWKPVKGMLRFFLIESSRGQIMLITSDLEMEPLTALDLYCHRVTIETLFNSLKNLLGATRYHFWSSYLEPSSRKPKRNDTTTQISSNPEKTQNTLKAIEKFMHVQMLGIGMLQLLARQFAKDVHARACGWLRTPCGEIPSEFVTRTALSNIVRANLASFGNDTITCFIRKKQNILENPGIWQDAA